MSVILVECELSKSCLSQKRQTKWQPIAGGFYLRANKNNTSTLFHYFMLSTPPALPSLAFPSHQWDCCWSGTAGLKDLLVSCSPTVCSSSCVPRSPPAMAGAFQNVSPTEQGLPNLEFIHTAQHTISFPTDSFDKPIVCTSTLHRVPCV